MFPCWFLLSLSPFAAMEPLDTADAFQGFDPAALLRRPSPPIPTTAAAYVAAAATGLLPSAKDSAPATPTRRALSAPPRSVATAAWIATAVGRVGLGLPRHLALLFGLGGHGRRV